MNSSAIVLGAGMVGVSAAVQLARKGWKVTLVDKSEPGSGATFGNAGMIQMEAVEPASFPRAPSELIRISGNRQIDVAYSPAALPGLAPALLRYWYNSAPARYQTTVKSYAKIIRHCVPEHMEIARQAGSEDQLRETGYLLICESPQTFEKAAAQAERVGTTHGVGYKLLSPEELALDQPLIKRRMSGAIHWTEPRSVPDPQILTQRYAGFLSTLGGAFVKGDAMSLSQQGNGWTVMTDEGLIEAEHVVVAIGHASTHLTKRFGYAAPTFGKRGYHIHLKAGESLMPSRPVLYQDKRIMIAPMRQGLRLTSGVEFARPDAPKTPLQLGRAENVIRELFELGEHVEAQPWMGVRPASADMLPIVGPIPGTKGLWAHYGHGHQGLTLGPTTGRLLAEQMSSERTFVDPTPFLPARFA